MAEFMKGTGLITINMVKDMKNISMELNILEHTKKENLQAMADIPGIMGKHMKVSGRMV